MPSACAKVGVAGAPLLHMRGRRAGTAHARPVRQLYLDSCGDSQEYSHMFNIFRSDFQKGEGRKIPTMDHHVLKTCGECEKQLRKVMKHHLL